MPLKPSSNYLATCLFTISENYVVNSGRAKPTEKRKANENQASRYKIKTFVVSQRNTLTADS